MTWASKLFEKRIDAVGGMLLVNPDCILTDDLVSTVLEKNKENEQKVIKEAKKCKLCEINEEIGWTVCLEHVELRTNLAKDEARAFRELVDGCKKVKQ